MSVNVSAHQPMSADFVASVDDVLLATQIKPGLLALEVTGGEFVAMSRPVAGELRICQ